MNHTESAGGVVLNREGKVLLVSQHATSWSLPKGHIEAGEDPITAAKREIYEESGVSELIFVRELGRYERSRIGKDGGEDATETKTIHMFFFTTTQDLLNPEDVENPEARWVDKFEVSKLLTHDKDKEFFNSVLKRLYVL